MYVVVTSKPGVYSSNLEAKADLIEAYDYFFCGRRRAVFHVAQLQEDGYVIIREEEPPHVTNRVPTKFLESFGSLEEARSELDNLVRFGNLDVRLERLENPSW